MLRQNFLKFCCEDLWISFVGGKLLGRNHNGVTAACLSEKQSACFALTCRFDQRPGDFTSPASFVFFHIREKDVSSELTDHQVDFVVNSHWHYDHTDGNENFGRAGALIVAHDNSRRRMATDQVVSLSNRAQPAYSDVGLPKITFLESMRFYYNDNTIDVFYTGPGHTDGDAQVYFRDSNVIHTGDMFVRYGLPYIDHGNGGSLDGMIDALWAIAGLIDDQTIIIPGHGQLSRRTDLLEFRAMLATIRDRIKSGIARGLSVEQVIASNPARGYADPGGGTPGWVTTAYESYR